MKKRNYEPNFKIKKAPKGYVERKNMLLHISIYSMND